MSVQIQALPYDERQRKALFVSYFDKTPEGIICPHFHILAHGNYCQYGCSYCFLGLTFFRQKYQRPVVYANTKKLLKDVEKFLASDMPSVLNTGELTDGLALDKYTGLSKLLVPMFAQQKKHKLLFLTKSDEVDNLLGLNHNGQTIVSFSVNAFKAAEMFEGSAPHPKQRIEAAVRVKREGYELRLRIDPIITFNDKWRLHYWGLIDFIREAGAEPSRYTLGTPRFFGALKNINKGRPGSEIFAMFPWEKTKADKRFRMQKERRLEIYSALVDKIGRGKFALCKEEKDVWEALGISYENIKCNCSL